MEFLIIFLPIVLITNGKSPILFVHYFLKKIDARVISLHFTTSSPLSRGLLSKMSAPILCELLTKRNGEIFKFNKIPQPPGHQTIPLNIERTLAFDT